MMLTTRTQVNWRRKGATKPADTVLVARPSRWGNPFKVEADGVGQERAVRLFREWIHQPEQTAYRVAVKRELRGKRLACYCAAHLACHADVLAEVAEQ